MFNTTEQSVSFKGFEFPLCGVIGEFESLEYVAPKGWHSTRSTWAKFVETRKCEGNMLPVVGKGFSVKWMCSHCNRTVY